MKCYAARSYRVSAGDPLTSNYRFLDVDRAVPALDPWGTDTCQTHEQTYTLIHVDGDTMIFSTYMFRYDGRRDQMMTAPYLYDSLILRRGDTARADMAATAEQAPGGVPSEGYADVPENAWYAGAVNTVSARGLLDVRSESRFAPGESLTRPNWSRRFTGWPECLRQVQGQPFRMFPAPLAVMTPSPGAGQRRAGVRYAGRPLFAGSRDHPRTAGGNAVPLFCLFRGKRRGRQRHQDLCRLAAGGGLVPGTPQLGGGDRPAERGAGKPLGSQRRRDPCGRSGIPSAAAIKTASWRAGDAICMRAAGSEPRTSKGSECQDMQLRYALINAAKGDHLSFFWMLYRLWQRAHTRIWRGVLSFLLLRSARRPWRIHRAQCGHPRPSGTSPWSARRVYFSIC